MGQQQPLEMILLRQLAKHLASPIWLLDTESELVFYNEPAEQILGIEFSEMGPVASVELTELFEVTEIDGTALAEEELPLVKSLRTRTPTYRKVRFRAKDGVWRMVEVLATPIIGHGERSLGVMASFWEVEG